VQASETAAVTGYTHFNDFRNRVSAGTCERRLNQVHRAVCLAVKRAVFVEKYLKLVNLTAAFENFWNFWNFNHKGFI
jgi:hypothetical protein